MAELPSAATSKVLPAELPSEATSKVLLADLRRRLRAERWQRAKQMRLLFLLPLAIFVIFHYLPMYGNIIAFKDFRLGRGYWGSRWGQRSGVGREADQDAGDDELLQRHRGRWVTFRNGKEGVHFDWDGEPYESFARNRAESDIPEGQGHGGISGYPVFYPVDRLQIIQPKPMAEFQSTYALVDGGARVYTTRSYRDDFFNETEYEDLRQRFISTLNTMWSEFFYKGITGQIDVDAEWDAYVQAWNDAGGADIVAELEKAPIVSEFRQGRRVY